MIITLLNQAQALGSSTFLRGKAASAEKWCAQFKTIEKGVDIPDESAISNNLHLTENSWRASHTVPFIETETWNPPSKMRNT